MRRRDLARVARAGLAGMMVAGVVALASCAPQPTDTAGTEPEAASEAISMTSVYTADFDPEKPVIKQLEDGRYVQRVPSMEADPGTPGIDNIDVLHADARGCGSCHDSIRDALQNIMPSHVGSGGVNGGLDIDLATVGCPQCHVERAFGDYAKIIHGIHNVEQDGEGPSCFSCHETNSETGELDLWDNVKYDLMDGITPIENVKGDFSFDQDTLLGNIPNIQWNSHDYDFIRWDHEMNGDERDEDTFNNWEFTVTGEVNEEKTFTLGELIEQAPSEEDVFVAQCETNPLGGNMVGQVKIKGIPFDWVLEQCGGFTDKAQGITTLTPTGTQGQYYGTSVSELATHKAYIVYEINGERLSWINGFPCVLWIGGQPASRIAKNFSEIVISDESYDGIAAGGENDTFRDFKPNVGIINTVEGQIIEAGKPYTFEGWASGWELPITAVEFSMDGGETWDRCDTPNTNTDQWVHWTYTFTPEAGVDTAYLLSVRAYGKTINGETVVYTVPQIGLVDSIIKEDERVTKVPFQVMVNAKADMNSIEVTEQ